MTHRLALQTVTLAFLACSCASKPPPQGGHVHKHHHGGTLVHRFEQAAKMMKTVAKGGMPNMPGMGPMPPGMRPPKKAAKPQGKQQRRSGNPAKRSQAPAVEAAQGSAFGKPKAEGAFGELSGPDQEALQRMLGNR